jgi:phage-related protein
MKNVPADFKKRKNQELTTPIFLYAIQFDKQTNSWLRYTSYPENVTFDGLLYTKYVIWHDKISENLNGKIDRVNLTIGNVDRQIGYYLENYNGLREAEVRIKLVFLEELSNALVYDENVFAIADVSVNSEYADFVLASKLDVMDIRIPKRNYYRTFCTHIFKDEGCAYSGVDSACNKTFQRCIELENIHRFGGFPAIPQKTVFLK